MSKHPVGIVMNGVTGRMGYNQHLVRSIMAIRDDGGVATPDGRQIWPEPILVGRDAEKLQRIAKEHGLDRWTTSLDEALAFDDAEIYFDSLVTTRREDTIRAAIAAGKHVYTEKPLAGSLDGALTLARLAAKAQLKTGVVQDKLFLPGMRKLARLVDTGFFGRLLSVRGEFGYWVFEGGSQPSQRPSWNYRLEDGGGIILDMFCHWRYVLDNLFGPVRAVQALGVTHIPERVGEDGNVYRATADDAAYAIFEIEGGVIAQVNSSWAVRVNRDELVEFQVDGTDGSAVAGLHGCKVQHKAMTPRAVWTPDLPSAADYRSGWAAVPDNMNFGNAFRVQWELFLRHVVCGEAFPWDFLAGARGVQLAALGLQSWREGRRLEVAELTL